MHEVQLQFGAIKLVCLVNNDPLPFECRNVILRVIERVIYYVLINW